MSVCMERDVPEGENTQLVVFLPDLLLVFALAYSSINHCFPAFVQPPKAQSALKV